MKEQNWEKGIDEQWQVTDHYIIWEEWIKHFIKYLIKAEKELSYQEGLNKKIEYDKNGWKELVKEEKERANKQGVEKGIEKNKELLKRLKLEFDVVVCKCGDEWKDSDAADIVNEALNNLKKSITDDK